MLKSALHHLRELSIRVMYQKSSSASTNYSVTM